MVVGIVVGVRLGWGVDRRGWWAHHRCWGWDRWPHVIVGLLKMGVGVVVVGAGRLRMRRHHHREAGTRLGVDGRRVADGWLGVVTVLSPLLLEVGVVHGGGHVAIVAESWVLGWSSLTLELKWSCIMYCCCGRRWRWGWTP